MAVALGLSIGARVELSVAAGWQGLASKNNLSQAERERREEEESNRLRGEELRTRFPDLRLRSEPR
ncbi:MAG TPA: hypothetical protein VEQ59_25495, partial [Polyangiaceae bacterium]|nr:hypothetical protein [Polyangiaceae bacterium]